MTSEAQADVRAAVAAAKIAAAAVIPLAYIFWNPGQVLETTSEGMSEFYNESVKRKYAQC